jgi:hypothetical protein
VYLREGEEGGGGEEGGSSAEDLQRNTMVVV